MTHLSLGQENMPNTASVLVPIKPQPVTATARQPAEAPSDSSDAARTANSGLSITIQFESLITCSGEN